MASTKTITINYGSTTVTLNYVTAQSAHPSRQKNFTEHVLENNSRVRDDSGNPKRRWEFNHEVPLTSDQKTNLETLFLINGILTLTENFVESGTTYQVHFEVMQRRLNSPVGDDRYYLVFQEL